MRYIARIYKYGRFSHEITGKAEVLPRFYEDMSYCKPCNVRENKKTVTVAFSDYKYTTTYTVPKEHYKGV